MKTTEDVENIIKKMKLPFSPTELQKEDAMDAYLADRFGFFYAVGGGKTFVSTLTALLWGEKHTIIICPPILSLQWKYWLNSIKQKDVSVFAGVNRTSEMLNHKWVIMSHSIFRDSSKDIIDFYKEKSACLIIDEAQAIKNSSSLIFKKVFEFIDANRKCLLLTATPTSSPQDTYAYIKIKTGTIYRNLNHWRSIHIDKSNASGEVCYRNLDLLSSNFTIKAATRTKQDLFGFNLDPIYQPILYNLSPKHFEIYKKLAEDQLLILDNESKIDVINAQKLYHALQKLIINYEYFSGGKNHRSSSFDLLDEIIEEVDPIDKSKSKLCIWTYYKASSKSVTNYLKNKFGEEAIVSAYGDVNSGEAIKEIMNNDKCRILVGQPSSVGVGLNLHHVCSEMLFLEQSTTPMQTRQAVGRIDRIGQKIRPTIRFAQANETIQVRLFQNLLANDDLVSIVERTPKSLREEIFGL